MTSSDTAARLLDRLPDAVRRYRKPRARETIEHDALLRVAGAVAGADKIGEVLEVAAEEALRATGAAALAINRFEDGGRRYRTLINVGTLNDWEERLPAGEVYEVDRFPGLREMSRTGNPYFNSLEDPDCGPASRELLAATGKSSDLGVAIVVEGEVWGGIWAGTASGSSFEAGDVRFLEAIGGQIATAIARIELFSRVSRLAYEDPLTGLANRRALEERLARALDRYAAGESTVALMLCDADRLKQINDVHGHAGGDAALRNVATALVAAAAVHPGAFVARIGGDEFCVLIESLERIGEGGEFGAIEALAATAQGELADLRPAVTLSYGAATATARTATASKLLAAADTAQYVAKRRGGNRIFTTAQIAEIPHPFTDVRVGGSAERITSALAEITAALAGELADAPALDRLERAGAALVEAGDLAACAISFAAHGSGILRELSHGDNRGERGPGLHVVRSWEEPELYKLDDFPETARIVAAGGGSFIARVDDGSCDAAERAQLELDGYTALAAAAAGNDDGVYFVELLSDRPGADVGALEPALALAVAAAVPPQPHRRTAGSAPAGQRALELTVALTDRLAGATTEREVVAAAAEELQRAFGCTAVQIMAVVDEMLELRAERGEARIPASWSQRADAGLIGRCLRERAPVPAVDVTREPRYRAITESQDRIRSELAVPIFDGYDVWGAINLEDARVGLFGPGDTRLVESVAAQVGGAITSIRLYEQIDRAYLGTAEALMAALEEKDSYTAAHSRSLADNAVAVGRELGMPAEELRMLRYAAAFHDVGKIAISPDLLNKPGPLTDAEWEQMRLHTVIGERIVAPIEFLAPIRPLVRCAHEQWDGKGYPAGLAGEEIPLGARIIFACDAYDAMTSDRPYRAAMTPEQARRELRAESGRQFDPVVADALLMVLDGASSNGADSG